MVQLWRSFGYLIPLVATVGAVVLVAGRTAVVDDVVLAVGGGVLGCAAGRAMRRHRVPAEVAEASVA